MNVCESTLLLALKSEGDEDFEIRRRWISQFVIKIVPLSLGLKLLSMELEAESRNKYCLLREQENIKKMEQNETGCQAPQAPVVCVNNCGFFGTAATMNMCSKCYRDMVLKQQQAKFAASSIESIVNESSNTNGKGSTVAILTDVQTASPDTVIASTQVCAVSPATEKSEEGPKRCITCRKRVGLTGFSCRCGNLFCSVHRYSDKHECPFDYHAAGQESIAKANPVVRAEKLDKI